MTLLATSGRPPQAWCLRAAVALAALQLPALIHAQATQVQATLFTDVNFGAVDFSSDLVRAQDLCVYVSGTTHNYNVRAVGSGTGSAFTLSNGATTMAYDVQWNGNAGQTSGSALTANVARSGFTSAAAAPTCTVGAATSASLILILRAVAAQSAGAGSYSGSLSVTITPE